MHTCQTIANYSSYAILSCSDCLEQCQTLYNHSAFCILECHAPTTTTPLTTTPITTTPITTTPIVTTPITTTPIVTTPPIATTTNVITTSLLTTTAISDGITPPTFVNASNATNIKYQTNNFSVGVAEDNTNIQTNTQGFFAFVLLIIPILFLVCVTFSYICRRKKSLVRKKSRSVLPLEPDEVVINVDNNNDKEENTIVNENDEEENTKEMIIKTVVASVVDDMIRKLIEKAKLPSVSDAAKTLQGLRLAKRKLLRQRKKRERGLHNLVLRNMKQQNVQKRGMTIREIFEHKNQNSKKPDFDML